MPPRHRGRGVPRQQGVAAQHVGDGGREVRPPSSRGARRSRATSLILRCEAQPNFEGRGWTRPLECGVTNSTSRAPPAARAAQAPATSKRAPAPRSGSFPRAYRPALSEPLPASSAASQLDAGIVADRPHHCPLSGAWRSAARPWPAAPRSDRPPQTGSTLAPGPSVDHAQVSTGGRPGRRRPVRKPAAALGQSTDRFRRAAPRCASGRSRSGGRRPCTRIWRALAGVQLAHQIRA